MSRLKVYCETSFWSYLTGRTTSDQKVARWQSLTLKWFEEELPRCDVSVSDFVVREAQMGNAEQVGKRLEILKDFPSLDTGVEEIFEIAKRLLEAHALPSTEHTDALHIATAAFHGMDVLLTWNCKHLANLFTLPKTMAVIAQMGYQCPLIITPERYLEDIHHEQ